MARSQNKYADFAGLRERAVALRRTGYSLRRIRDELKVFNNDILNRLVKGEPPPEWTKRPRAKDDLRAKARELRLQRRNTGDDCRGCLVLTVRRSAQLYRRTEGWWTGIVADAVTRLR